MDAFELKRNKVKLLKSIRKNSQVKEIEEKGADKVFFTCPVCKNMYSQSKLSDNLNVCPNCGHYHKLRAYDRIEMVCDEDSFKEHSAKVQAADVLKFPGYTDEIKNAKKASGLNEAFVYGSACVDGRPLMIGVMDSMFIMGSLSTAAGEKIARCFEYAASSRLPVLIFTASGGARMHEGTVSLMQMAKTSAAVKRFSDSGGLYISCMTDPTTGGVTASFASLGDIILAEPGALIGFAGPRVIEQTIGEKLPDGFQRSEYLLQHGFIDMIVSRENMRATISKILRLHERRT